MDYQYIFERVESKYTITKKQYEEILRRCSGRITEDVFPHSDISSIYFDSSTYSLARNSLDHPAYKEKLRLRSYGNVEDDSTVFFEIKKKYNGVIYKRRQDMTYTAAKRYTLFNKMPCDTQIMKEIDYLCNGKEELKPVCMINYQRDSFTGVNEADLRITFDYDLCYTLDNLVLTNRKLTPLTNEDLIIMEIKTLTAMPLWLTAILDEMKIYPSNFSKYGTVYRNNLSKGAQLCSTYYSHHYFPIRSALQTTS